MKPSLVSLTLPILMASIPATHASWEELPPLPVPNGGGICGAVDSRIVMVGGTNWEGGSKNWLRTTYTYDPARKAWSQGEDLPAPIAYGVKFDLPGGFGFLGGSDGTQPVKKIAILEGTRPRWQPVPDLPAAVVLSAGGLIAGQYIIVGGTDDAANIAGVQRTTHVITATGTPTVKRQADYPGPGFAVAASAVASDELFIFGGANWNAAKNDVTNTTEAHAFSPTNNTWRPLRPLPKATRGLSAIALDAGRLYLAGGFSDVFTAEAWIYDIAADRYVPATPLPIPGMVSLVRCDGHLYSIAGEDKMKSRTARCFRIPLAALHP